MTIEQQIYRVFADNITDTKKEKLKIVVKELIDKETKELKEELDRVTKIKDYRYQWGRENITLKKEIEEFNEENDKLREWKREAKSYLRDYLVTNDSCQLGGTLSNNVKELLSN